MSMPDLKVKDGVVLRAAHLRPHMTAIIDASLQTSPQHGGNVVTITSAKRPDEGGRSRHPMCGAFDFRCKSIIARSQTERITLATNWAGDMADLLGEDYDVIAHGEGDDLHVHAEYDPK